MSNKGLNVFSLALVVVAAGLLAFKNYDRNPGRERIRLLNVSYDPTRELYQEINRKFLKRFAQETGRRISIQQSHGGSSRQAHAVADGLAADVVTLALPSDVEGLHQRGLIAADWPKRLPHEAQPYTSTIVFVVRKTNPKRVKDWPDLIAPGVQVVTPNPKTSGNGKLSVLAAWGSVLLRGGSEEEARAFVTKLYEHAGVLGAGARDSANTFALAKEGDVHLTWENEALREAAEAAGELEIIYPPASIRAEPSVSLVDANVTKHQTAPAANAYLAYLFTDEAQEIFAQHGYRPIKEEILNKHADRFPKIQLFPVTLVAKDWQEAQEKFFGENGIFDALAPAKSK
jgi:sulfate/thiosulfate transport system substrate-binding protein